MLGQVFLSTRMNVPVAQKEADPFGVRQMIAEPAKPIPLFAVDQIQPGKLLAETLGKKCCGRKNVRND